MTKQKKLFAQEVSKMEKGLLLAYFFVFIAGILTGAYLQSMDSKESEQKGVTLGDNDVCIENKTEYSAEVDFRYNETEFTTCADVCYYYAMDYVNDGKGSLAYNECMEYKCNSLPQMPQARVVEHTYCVAKEHKEITRVPCEGCSMMPKLPKEEWENE
jgi:hypothetical protein